MSRRNEDARGPNWRARFVSTVWATHNTSRPIRRALNQCLARLGPESRGLNVGSGANPLHPRVLNLDIQIYPNLDVCGFAEALPFADSSFDVVISQETLEHVRDPFQAMREMGRVLRPGGVIYCQLPFIIGYHPGPTDFWRFTREGIQAMTEQAGLRCEEVRMSVGPATGCYRIAVEFFATILACIWSRLYLPGKGLAALLFYPLKWLDPLLMRGAQSDRIAGGYFVIGRR